MTKRKIKKLENNAADEITNVIKPRKRRKTLDPAWGKQSESKNRRTNSTAKIKSTLAMRANNQKINPATGSEVKTAAILHPAAINAKNVSPNTISINFSKKIAALSSDRPIAEIQYDEKGAPIFIFTPGKTKLNRHKTNPFMTIFTNLSPERTPNTPIKFAEFFFKSEAYQSVKQPSEKIKYREIVITPTYLANLKGQHNANGKQRSVSQNRVMAETAKDTKNASAKRYADATEVFSADVQWEWLHLIAHSMQLELSQVEGNIIAGTKHANTDMMFAEELARNLAKKFPAGVRIKTHAKMIPDSQFASEIDYVIETDDFTIPFKFKPHTHQQPHIFIKDYLAILADVLTEPKPTVKKLINNFHSKDSQVDAVNKSSDFAVELPALDDELAKIYRAK
jgi:hypothetical protein